MLLIMGNALFETHAVERVMEPEIVSRGPLWLAGFSFFGDPFAKARLEEGTRSASCGSALGAYWSDMARAPRHIVEPGGVL
jgi:hypothetical protein